MMEDLAQVEAITESVLEDNASFVNIKKEEKLIPENLPLIENIDEDPFAVKESILKANKEENKKQIEMLQKQIFSQEQAIVESIAKKEMSPLMLFMTSSLNVEMVYTILYGICKFTLLNYIRNMISNEHLKQFRKMEYKVD